MAFKRNVLVLNQDYSPISICSAERAFLLIYLHKAELVAKAENEAIRSISKSYPMPSVVRLNRYINIPYRGVVLTRHNVFKRDGFSCQYCGVTKDLTIDHVIPRSKGGNSSWKNLVTACKKCNAKKGDQTPEGAGMKLNKIPGKPSYVMFLKELGSDSKSEWEPFLSLSG